MKLSTRSGLVVVAVCMFSIFMVTSPHSTTASTQTASPGRTIPAASATPQKHGTTPFTRVASAVPVKSDGPEPALPAANYDEQVGETFTQSFASLAYNVTAVEQTDSVADTGPAYLLDGLTNNGYWYQIGLSWNWDPGNNPGTGFDMNYEVFNTQDDSIFPANGGGGLATFSGVINQGDTVLLSLSFSGGTVVMQARDWNTGARASVSYSSEGGSEFSGLQTAANANGYFTGLMTEWYRASPYFGNEASVTYSDTTFALSSVYMWADEYNAVNLQAEFAACQYSCSTPTTYTNPDQFQTFSTNGISEESDAYELITGQTPQPTTTITLSPAGQSTPLSPSNEFSIAYTLNGAQATANYVSGTVALKTDSGTNLTISGVSTGSTSSERWVLNSQASPTVIASGSTVSFYYFDTFQEEAAYSLVGGGTPAATLSYASPPPTAASQLPTNPATLALSSTPQAIWVVKESTASVNSPVAGAAGEQWVATNAQWTVSSPNQDQFTVAYYHQYNVLVSYQITGGGAGYSPPTVSCTSLGQQSSVTLGSTLWLDAGSSCNYTATLVGSSQTQRWAIPSSSLTVAAPGTLSPAYYDQFFVTPEFTVTGGGSGYAVPTINCAQFGTQTALAVGSAAWVDAGSPCSYEGTLTGSTQNERWTVANQNVTVAGAGSITATYYHQYSLGLAYTISDGSSQLVGITGTSFGTTSTSQYSSGAVAWLDAGTQYSLSNPLPASSSSERWMTSATTNGTLTAHAVFSATYYHQLLVSALFSLVGGGSPPAPVLTYIALGSAASVSLTTTVQSFWADDGSHYSTPAQLNGSAATERWTDAVHSGTIQASATITVNYRHEFLLTVTGVVSGSKWFNATATATISAPGIYNRTAGVGERVAEYSLDGGTPTVVGPTTGAVTIKVQMDAAHQLSIISVKQYQVTLDPETVKALVSITAPSISGDDYWYDQGAPVNVVLNGVWNRSAGTGERLASYTVNGQVQAVATIQEVKALALTSISSPENVSAAITIQYQLTTSSGSVESVTAPAISGDAGWYDAATQVTVVYNYTWDSSGQSRVNAISYTIGSAAPKGLAREAGGAFPVQFTMTGPQSVAVQSVTQYTIAVSGGNDVVVSAPSPTGDSFYDSGSTITVSTDYTWDIVDGNTRQNLFSYTLDGDLTNVTRADSGTFTTPVITFTGPQDLAFTSVTQYLISFQFRDSSGTQTITPASFQIQLEDPQVLNVNQSQIWLDGGAIYQIYSVVWEGTNVTPSTQTLSTVGGPINQTVVTRVYTASVKATDYLGLPLSGAQLSITLANGTTIHRTTMSNGTANLGLIPLGTFQGSLSYLGTNTSISGDASTQTQAQVKVLASYATLGLIAIIIAGLTLGLLLALRRRRPAEAEPEGEEQVLAEVALCKHCGATIEGGEKFCPRCGKPRD